MRKIILWAGLGGLLFLVGCSHVEGNVGNMPKYSFFNAESEWIRNGDPIIFEGESWYPQDNYDVLQDAEVYLMGEYRGVQFFVDRVDVRPYDRLYTKFDRNKFRVYKKRTVVHDQDY